MSHNPFETAARDYVKKISEKHAEASHDDVLDDTEEKEIRQQAEAIREFLEGNKEKNPDDIKAREEALYKAIIQVTEENPDIPISEICNWIFEDVAKDIFKYELKEMLDKKDKFPPILVRLYLSDLATKKPCATLKNAKSYKDQPYVGEIIMIAAEKDPREALEHADCYKDQPRTEEIIEKAAFSASEKYPWSVFAYAASFKDQPYAKEVMMIAVEKDTSSAIEYFGRYQDQLYAKDILLIAANLDPWNFVKLQNFVASYFSTEDWTLLQNHYKNYLESIEEKGDKDFPSKVIQKDDFPIDRQIWNFSMLRANQESVAQEIPRGILIDIPFKDFEKIFFSEPAQNFFKLHAGEFTYMNAISVCKIVYRKLCKEGKVINDKTIQEALAAIAEEREKVSDRELFGPHTKLILFAHEEERFNTDEITRKLWKRCGGKEEDVIANEKGIRMEGKINKKKEQILQAIRGIKGPTTILFNGHGSPENWAFAFNTADNLNRSLIPSPTTINYKELGDALIASGHIADVNLIGDTCFAYDYLMNLFIYLESKGVKEKPYVSISAANKKKLGQGGKGEALDSRLLTAFHKVSKDNEPTTVGHFFKTEGLLWKFEDPALFVEKIHSLPQSPSPAPETQPKHFLEIGGDHKYNTSSTS